MFHVKHYSVIPLCCCSSLSAKSSFVVVSLPSRCRLVAVTVSKHASNYLPINTSNTLTSLGLTPGILLASPIVFG